MRRWQLVAIVFRNVHIIALCNVHIIVFHNVHIIVLCNIHVHNGNAPLNLLHTIAHSSVHIILRDNMRTIALCNIHTIILLIEQCSTYCTLLLVYFLSLTLHCNVVGATTATTQ